MKKLLALVLTLLVVCPAAFAGELTSKGVLAQSIQISGKGAGAAKQEMEKSRLVLGYKTEDVKATIITKISDPAVTDKSFDIDYAFADVKCPLTDGTIRAGLQRLGIANYGGGIYQTNTFLAARFVKGVGLSLANKIEGVTVKAFVDNGVAEKVDKRIALLAKGKVEGANVAGYVVYKDNQTADKQGMNAGLDVDYKMDAVKLALQLNMDMGDDAAQARGAAIAAGNTEAKAEMLVGLYAAYDYGMGNLFVDYVMAGNEDTEDQTGEKSELSYGISYDINKSVKAIVEQIVETDANDTAKATATLGIQATF